MEGLLGDAWQWIVDKATLDNLGAFLNSAFTTSALGALLGAYFGAKAAQQIAERSKHREELIREIRNTNAAISVAFSICQGGLNLKKQQVRPMKVSYDAAKAALDDHMARAKTGQLHGEEPFAFTADLQTLQEQPIDTNLLRTLVFERLSVQGRSLNLVLIIAKSGHDLHDSIQLRNGLIEGYKQMFGGGAQGIENLYFGLPQSGGVNLEYPQSVKAIATQTDDVIWFSHRLCLDLQLHGESLADQFKKKFKREPRPIVTQLDLTEVIAEKLIPGDDDYRGWVTGFVKK